MPDPVEVVLALMFLPPEEWALWAAYYIGLTWCLDLCHEAGHYWAAAACGVGSDVFCVGRGPILLTAKGADEHGCAFQVAIIPLGGYVRYGQSYNALSAGRCALLAAGGWMVDVLTAGLVLSAAALMNASHPLVKFACCVVCVRVIYNLSPFTPDGRKFVAHLWQLVRFRS